MLAFYFILTGMYLYYSKSKYFPTFLSKPSFQGMTCIGSALLILGSALYVRSDGWAGGLLLAIVVMSLAMGLIQLFAVLGRTYFYGLITIVHVLVLIELISYAS